MMKIFNSKNRSKTIAFILLLIITFIWLLPLLWGLATSFKSQSEVASHPISLIPRAPTLQHYKELFSEPTTPVLRWLLNSFVIASAHTILYLIVATGAAYAFSLLNFKFKNLIFAFLLATTTIPSVINLVPLLTMMIDMNWFNSWIALIVPGLGGVFGMFLMRQFFLSVPKEVIESAKMDGLGHFGIFMKIVLPLSKSVIMVAGLLAFMGNWNDFLWPQLIMAGSDINSWTLPHGLSTIISGHNYKYGLSMAAAMVSIVPVVIAYLFVQDNLIESVARTGIK